MADKYNDTSVTQIVGTKDSQVSPLMSYEAITTHTEMANAFINHIITYSQRIIPDRKITIEDLITICHAAINRQSDAVAIVEGKYLRGRISEQLSRAKRYKEPFSLISLRLANGTPDTSYETVIDALSERLRQSDMIFTFKGRVILILPHTEEQPTLMLLERLKGLIEATFEATPLDKISYLAFPNPTITRSSQVLDWAEDQLR